MNCSMAVALHQVKISCAESGHEQLNYIMGHMNRSAYVMIFSYFICHNAGLSQLRKRLTRLYLRTIQFLFLLIASMEMK